MGLIGEIAGFGNPQQNTVMPAPTSTSMSSSPSSYTSWNALTWPGVQDNFKQWVKDQKSKGNIDKTYADYNGDWKAFLEDQVKKGDTVALDRLLNYLMSEQSAQTARDWQSDRDDHAYSRLAADLRAAGFNPAFLMSNGGSPVVSQASGNSYGGNYASSYQNAAYRNEVYYKLGKGALANQRFGIIMNFLGTVVSSASHLAGAAIGAM